MGKLNRANLHGLNLALHKVTLHGLNLTLHKVTLHGLNHTLDRDTLQVILHSLIFIIYQKKEMFMQNLATHFQRVLEGGFANFCITLHTSEYLASPNH